MTLQLPTFNPKLDLMFERIVELPRELIWAAWTQPDQILHWFTPQPWKTIACEIDLKPGGLFSTMMQSPEGQNFPNLGSYLEVVPNEKLVWTNAFEPGFRPAQHISVAHCNEFPFTAIIALTPQGENTKYTAMVMHGNEDARQKHEAMGFQEGWGKALDQLVAYVKNRNK